MRKGMFKFLLVLGGALLCSSFTTDKSYYPSAVNEPECAPGFICNIESGTGMHICVVPELDNGTDCYGGGTEPDGGDNTNKCEYPEICLHGMLCVVNQDGLEVCVVPTGLNNYQMENQTVWGKVKSWLSNLL